MSRKSVKQMRRYLMDKTFEKAHRIGAKRHGALWLKANEAAVDIMRHFGWDTTNPELRAMSAAITLKVLNEVKEKS